MPSLACPLPPGLSLATPEKRRRLTVPATSGRLQPLDNLLWRLRMLAIQGPALADPLHGFRHVQPRAAQRGIERHDAMREQPQHEGSRGMPGEIVEHQEHPQRRQLPGQGDPDREPGLPLLPAASILLGWEDWRLGQRGQDGRQLGLQPGMEHSVGGASYPLDPHGTAGGMEQRQLLSGSLADVLVRVVDGRAGWMPVLARIGQRLVRTGLVFRPNRQTVLRIGRLD